MTANNTADQKYKCSNAFKEKGKTYRYDDIIEEAEYQSISENNKKWFYPVAVPLAPQNSGYELNNGKELIATFEKYVKLLTDEIEELIGLVNVHQWKSHRAEIGKEFREKIALLKTEPTPAADTVNKTEGENK